MSLSDCLLVWCWKLLLIHPSLAAIALQLRPSRTSKSQTKDQWLGVLYFPFRGLGCRLNWMSSSLLYRQICCYCDYYGDFHVCLFFAVSSWYRLHRKVQCPQLVEDSLPGVSILKPLTGVDPNLFANLETFFNIKYPTVSICRCRHWCFDCDIEQQFRRCDIAYRLTLVLTFTLTVTLILTLKLWLRVKKKYCRSLQTF